MSEFSNDPIAPSQSEMSLIDTWISAVTKPNESTFAEIASQPSASTGKAALWVFVASLLTGFATLVSQAVTAGSQMGGLQKLLPPDVARELPIGSGSSAIGFGTVICGTPVAAGFSVLVFLIGVALVQWIAKMFGGTGSFDKLAYSFSAIMVPYSVVAAVLTLFGMIPFVGILTGLISFALGIYVVVLQVLAVKAVNGLDTGKAVGAVLLPGLAVFLLICCCVVVGMTVMGAAIGDVFSGIGQGINGY